MNYYNQKLKPFARELQKGMTLPEKKLWLRIRRKQINKLQFYRQKVLGVTSLISIARPRSW